MSPATHPGVSDSGLRGIYLREEAKKRALASVAAALLLGTGAGFAGPASIANADSDYASRSGECSKGADYTMTVREKDHPDRLKTTFYINGKNSRGDRTWTIRIYRNGDLVSKWSQRSNSHNNVKFVKTIRGDDEDRVTIYVKSSYGETCKRTIVLDHKWNHHDRDREHT